MVESCLPPGPRRKTQIKNRRTAHGGTWQPDMALRSSKPCLLEGSRSSVREAGAPRSSTTKRPLRSWQPWTGPIASASDSIFWRGLRRPKSLQWAGQRLKPYGWYIGAGGILPRLDALQDDIAAPAATL